MAKILEFDATNTTASDGSLTNVIGNPWSVVRNSIATYRQDQSTLIQVGANVPRIEDNKVLIESAATNSMLGTTFVGAVSGTPGTKPDNWSDLVSDGTIVVSTGELSGTQRLRISTSASARQMYYQDVDYGGVTTEEFYFSCKMIATGTGIKLQDLFQATGSITLGANQWYVDGVAEDGGFIPVVGSEYLIEWQGTITAAAAVQYRLGIITNSISDTTILNTQMERAGFSSFIPTDASAVTREADVITNTVPAGTAPITMTTWIDGVSDGGQVVNQGDPITMVNGTTSIEIDDSASGATTTVEIEWVDSISVAATGNKIYRDTVPPTGEVEIADIANGIQFYSDATAETGTEYKYEVQAHDGAGDETTQEVTGVNTQTITTV